MYISISEVWLCIMGDWSLLIYLLQSIVFQIRIHCNKYITDFLSFLSLRCLWWFLLTQSGLWRGLWVAILTTLVNVFNRDLGLKSLICKKLLWTPTFEIDLPTLSKMILPISIDCLVIDTQIPWLLRFRIDFNRYFIYFVCIRFILVQ
jgi:hypothetical protein